MGMMGLACGEGEMKEEKGTHGDERKNVPSGRL
jgi:hypothetical protein